MENYISNIDLYTSVLSIVFAISFLLQAWYYLAIFTRARKENDPPDMSDDKMPPVSVIICARNEAENLRKYLPSVLTQDYPRFEVIVVNDCSEDDTADVLEEFSKRYPVLKVSEIRKDPVFSHGKKLALAIGIKASKYAHLLLTDADCEPATDRWIRYMAGNFNQKAEIVAGIGLYKKRKGLLNLFIRFDTAFIVMQYTSLARMGRPYMGVGRNLAYTRDLFFRNRGFASHSGLRSGDDDLFVSETAVASNTVVENHPESYTFSDPKESWREWFSQKRRHLTTGKFYQQPVKRILGLEYSSRILVNLSFVLLLFHPLMVLPAAAVYIIMLIMKGIIFNIVFRRLYEKFLFLPSLLFEPLVPVVYALLHLGNYIEKKRNRWN